MTSCNNIKVTLTLKPLDIKMRGQIAFNDETPVQAPFNDFFFYSYESRKQYKKREGDSNL